MSDQRFTRSGDRQIEDGIRLLLARITAAVVAELAPDAVVLSGSFARGEGGAYLADDALRLTSDIDLIAVYRGPGSVLRAMLNRSRAAGLAPTLQRIAPGARVDLVVRPTVLFSHLPATLDAYELLRSGRALHGIMKLPPPRAVQLQDVPPGEIVRKLQKRGAALVFSWLELMAADGTLDPEVARSVQRDVDKAFLVCGDAWLFRCRRYDYRLPVRIERFRSLPAIQSGPSVRLCEEYERSGREKMLPSPCLSLTRSTHFRRWHDAAQEWLHCYQRFMDWAGPEQSPPLSAWSLLGSAHRTIGAVRRLRQRLPSAPVVRQTLPSLLQLMLGSRDDAALSAAVATQLRIVPMESPNVVALARAWLAARRAAARRRDGAP